MKLLVAMLVAAPALACTPLPARQMCLTAEALAPVLAAALQMEGARIEVLDYTRNPLPAGSPEFTRAGLSADGLWRGQWLSREGRRMPIWARVRVTDPEGSALAEWRRAGAPEVLRGDTVRVEVRSGAVFIAFEAAAETSARRGEAVLVRNPESGQRFRATVEAPGKVAVQK